MKTRQSIRLMNTLLILGIIFLLRFWNIRPEEKPEKSLDILEEISNKMETGYTYKGEYLIEIEKLQIEKQKIIDNMNFEQTIAFYNSGIYYNISSGTLARLKEIDNIIDFASGEIAKIPDPQYIKKRKLGL